MNTPKHSMATLALLISCLLVPSLAEAEQQVSSELLLPYFEVDLDGGLTTLFAVSNASEDAASFNIALYTNWGIKVLSEPATLEGGGVLTVNLAEWLLNGRLSGRSLDALDLEHLQAALCGHRSPQSELFYGSEVAPNRAVGYLKITAFGNPRPDSLWGDYFIADPLQNFAQGESLISLDTECGGSCKRHALRYLDGGAFDGGTQVIIWTGKAGRPSETGYYQDEFMVDADTAFFDMNGQLSAERSSGFKAVEIIDVSELGLTDPFGWLEVHTATRSFVSVRYSAENRFSVGLRSFCLRAPIGPGIRIEKSTNGEDADTPTGPELMVGDPVSWAYAVSNTGDQDLFGVTVSDDQGVDVVCPDDFLAAGKRMTCLASGIAVEGQYRNLGTVEGSTENGTRVTDSDPSHYLGKKDPGVQTEPDIDVEKSTNGHDADTAPGPSIREGDPVTWTYLVTNAGEQPLSNVTVTDDQGVAVSCPATHLAVGASMTCTASGTATVGQYRNVGTARGTGSGGDPVSDSDPSHYWGMKPPKAYIGIEKATNGHDADVAPGPSILVGDPVSWTYAVTNLGETRLTNVTVTDDQGVAVSCPKSALAAGESMTCTGSGTATLGQYKNVGTVRGMDPEGKRVSDDDPSHCWGMQPPKVGIDVEKYTNGKNADRPKGPMIEVGKRVTWTYKVKNTGETRLTNVTVTDDDHNVSVSCPKTSLGVDESMTCTARGWAKKGQYKNIGTARGMDSEGQMVSDEDPSHYYGYKNCDGSDSDSECGGGGSDSDSGGGSDSDSGGGSDDSDSGGGSDDSDSGGGSDDSDSSGGSDDSDSGGGSDDSDSGGGSDDSDSGGGSDDSDSGGGSDDSDSDSDSDKSHTAGGSRKGWTLFGLRLGS